MLTENSCDITLKQTDNWVVSKHAEVLDSDRNVISDQFAKIACDHETFVRFAKQRTKDLGAGP